MLFFLSSEVQQWEFDIKHLIGDTITTVVFSLQSLQISKLAFTINCNRQRQILYMHQYIYIVYSHPYLQQ